MANPEAVLGRKVFENVFQVAAYVAPIRARGRKLVTTNGCFDILHVGHVHYLYESARLGDILVVGVNCDEVVRKIKGEDRPIQSQDERCRVVAAFEMVDGAFIFREDDPREFLKVLCPDVHVKGGDYDAEAIVERETVESGGGIVKTVSFLEGHSTSALVERHGRSSASELEELEM